VRTLFVLTILALAARALAEDAASAAPRAEPAPATIATDDAYALAASPLEAHRPITSPSTFAMGVATLAGLGLLHWRRRRFVAASAAL
jgi:hypothetical protein